MAPVKVRRELAKALKLDLVGPADGLGNPSEVLPQAPSRWYLTGFIVPLDADPTQRADEDSTDEVDEAGDTAGVDDAMAPEAASARQRYLPSSIGLSVLVPESAKKMRALVHWGDYRRRKEADGHGDGEEWERKQQQEEFARSRFRRQRQDHRRSSQFPTAAVSLSLYLFVQ